MADCQRLVWDAYPSRKPDQHLSGMDPFPNLFHSHGWNERHSNIIEGPPLKPHICGTDPSDLVSCVSRSSPSCTIGTVHSTSHLSRALQPLHPNHNQIQTAGQSKEIAAIGDNGQVLRVSIIATLSISV